VVVQLKEPPPRRVVRHVPFSALYGPMAFQVVSDINANGFPELAVLATDWVSGKVVVQVKDASTGLLVRNLWFSDMYAPVAFQVVSDINANGFPELAVLATDWASGKVVVQVKDASTGLLVRNVWFNDMYAPVALQVIPDLNANGSSELAVLTMNSSLGKMVVQIKDPLTGLLVRNIWF